MTEAERRSVKGGKGFCHVPVVAIFLRIKKTIKKMLFFINQRKTFQIASKEGSEAVAGWSKYVRVPHEHIPID